MASANLYHIGEGYNISPRFVADYEPMDIEVTPSVSLPIFNEEANNKIKGKFPIDRIKPEFKTPKIRTTNLSLNHIDTEANKIVSGTILVRGPKEVIEIFLFGKSQQN